MNKKLFVGITIVIYSIFGFAEKAGTPGLKETIQTTQISEIAD
ncbi:hypothetical protein [Fictibacillus halophilus]|nr:hypothetical protein [Fictibacillus halophilus]